MEDLAKAPLMGLVLGPLGPGVEPGLEPGLGPAWEEMETGKPSVFPEVVGVKKTSPERIFSRQDPLGGEMLTALLHPLPQLGSKMGDTRVGNHSVVPQTLLPLDDELAGQIQN